MRSNQTSVVTITFNNYDELLATCNSINPIKDLVEHVAINGGKCEQSKQFLAQNPAIVSASEQDQGIADAFNKGILKSTGQYIIFVNSGDLLINPQYVLEAEKIFESQNEVDFIFGNLGFLHPEAGRLTYFFKPFKRLSSGQPYFFPTMIFRRTVFERLGLFNLNFKIGMDFDLIVRLEKYHLKGHYLNTNPVVLMDGHGISSQQEYKSILENEKALMENGVYSIQDFYNLIFRKIKFFVKKTLATLHLKEAILKYKRLKYSDKSSSK